MRLGGFLRFGGVGFVRNAGRLASGGCLPADMGLVRKRGTSTSGGEVGEKARRIEGTADRVCASLGVAGAGSEGIRAL